MKALVIAAHVDDAELSMGGTVCILGKRGYEVKFLTLIIPHEDRWGRGDDARKERRIAAHRKAALELGVTDLLIADMDPYTLQYDRNLVQYLDEQIINWSPDLVFTHWGGDTHQDHNHVSRATFSALRENNCSIILYHQMMMGGITPTAFRPQLFVDISEEIDLKMRALNHYDFIPDEKKEAIQAQARSNGSQIGVRYAEVLNR